MTLDGVLVLDKPAGPTSSSVVLRVKRLLGARRAGHLGTLDPAATGVLPIVLGGATRIAQFLAGEDKSYRASVRLGVATETGDAAGRPVRTGPVPPLSPEGLEAALASLRGARRQRPPMFSAVRVGGVRLYEIARQGEEVLREARPIVVKRLVALGIHGPEIALEIDCTKGTYVRVLAEELGDALGCPAHLAALRRLRAGPFTLARAVPLAALDGLAAADRRALALEKLVPIEAALAHLPARRLDAAEAAGVRHGRAPAGRGEGAGLVVLLSPEGAALAIARSDGGERLALARVLATAAEKPDPAARESPASPSTTGLPSPGEAATASLAPGGQRGTHMAKDTLSITDNRTGKSYEIPITDGTVRAMDLRQIKTGPSDFGMMTYDPAFLNTASCRSRITYIDGAKGVLLYRGYPIEQLAEKSTFLEVAYLLLNGELPNRSQYEEFRELVTKHTFVHENVKTFMDGFRYDAHPMGMLVSVVGALSTFYPEAKVVEDRATRRMQMIRLIAKMPTIAAFSYRHSMGMPYVYPVNDLSFAGNFLAMVKRIAEVKYEPHPTLERALDTLFILHADHEQNCSTSAMRSVGSSRVDPFSAVAAACAALFGPLHGGANEAVLRMLKQIGSVSNVADFVKRVKAGEGKLMGFGHRVYKSYDPRAKRVKQLADEVFEVTGRNPLLDIALELEKIALSDEYFVSRKLYPNVDFYSGLIYQAMGFPVDIFPVLFAIPRTAGWLAQWEEMLLDEEQKIARPRQVYAGATRRDYVPMDARK